MQCKIKLPVQELSMVLITMILIRQTDTQHCIELTTVDNFRKEKVKNKHGAAGRARTGERSAPYDDRYRIHD